MSLSQDLSPDASSALIHDAFDRSASIIKECGVEIESILILVVHKDDSGRTTADGHQDGSIFSSVGVAKAWIVGNTKIDP